MEICVAVSTERSESWDSDIYWSVGFPVMIFASLCAGFTGKGSGILHGLTLIAGQFTAMVIRTGEIGNMVVPGLIVAAILGSIISIGSYAGASLKKYFGK